MKFYTSLSLSLLILLGACTMHSLTPSKPTLKKIALTGALITTGYICYTFYKKQKEESEHRYWQKKVLETEAENIMNIFNSLNVKSENNKPE